MRKLALLSGLLLALAVSVVAQTTAPNVTVPPFVNGAQSPRILYSAPLTKGHASISATTLITAPATGTYSIQFAASLTDVGASCAAASTVAANVIYQDPNAASGQTVTVATFQTDGSGNGTKGTVALASGSTRPIMIIRVLAGTAIQVSTTYGAGTSCNPGPNVQVTPILTGLGQ